jgi:conjugal transfer pilus assembly protein TraW
MNCFEWGASCPIARLSLCALALLSIGATPAVRGENLGVIGPVYVIAEESALDTIMRRLKEKQRSGELKRIEQQAVKRAVDGAKNPAPVAGLTKVMARSSQLLDPTVVYQQAVTTDEGQIVVPAGARVNPLLVTRLTKRLVFFDGRDPAQSEAVRKLVVKHAAAVKPILVAGSWYDTAKAWKTQVYFDQQGRLSQRFGVRAVPTVISQQGAMLLREEVPAGELQ